MITAAGRGWSIAAAGDALEAYAVRDAIQQLRRVPGDLGLPRQEGSVRISTAPVRDVGTVLIRDRPAKEQLRCALELGQALWANDKKALAKLMGTWGSESHNSVPPVLNSNYAELRKAGHYNGAMLRYNGEWYWGIDRLPYLEAELARDLGCDIAHVVSPRTDADRGAKPLAEKPGPLQCELWFSFRSPYSYLALEQIEAILAPSALSLVLHPMLPMVTRGMPLPSVKRMYIAHDAKREADRLGIPFGEICDPIGAGVDQLHRDRALGRSARSAGAAFAKSAMRGIWAEARDVSEYVDLGVRRRARGPAVGRGEGGARRPRVAKWSQANASDLAVFGLWGVPSLKVGDLVMWGQDRLPLLADRLPPRTHARERDRAACYPFVGERCRSPSATVPADQGLTGLGLLMQLAGSVFAAATALLVLTILFDDRMDADVDTACVFGLLGFSIVRSIIHRTAGAQLVYGDPNMPTQRLGRLRRYIGVGLIHSLVFGAVLLRLHMPGRFALGVTTGLALWPITLLVITLMPRFRRFHTELPISEDKGFEGASIFMTVLGTCGLVGTATLMLVMVNVPGRELERGSGVLNLLALGMLLVRSVIHVQARTLRAARDLGRSFGRARESLRQLRRDPARSAAAAR